MAVRTDEPAPYAPSSAILDIIDRFRNVGLATPITADVLARVGVSDSLIPRTLKSLQQLDLIAEDGRPTAQLEGLRRATSEEFQPRLAEVIRAAYADVFQFADPATDDDTRVTDAFRIYNPVSMRPRMISLFRGLCEAAGIIKAAERKPSATPRAKAPAARPRSSVTKTASRTAATASAGARTPEHSLLPEPLMGLLRALPAGGTGWPQVRRDEWVKLFGMTLDFVIPVRDTEPPDPQADDA